MAVFHAAPDGTINVLQFPRFDYPLQTLLTAYGPPNDVYVFVQDILPVNTERDYEVLLEYRDQGMLVMYSGSTFVGEPIAVCPSLLAPAARAPEIWSWSPDMGLTLADIAKKYTGGFDDLSYYLPISEAAGFSPSEFYERFKVESDKDDCFSVVNPYVGK